MVLYQLVIYMENIIKMGDREKVSETLKDIKNSSNNDLKFALEFLNSDYDRTKEAIIQLTKHLDGIEIIYNKVLKEYENRNAR